MIGPRHPRWHIRNRIGELPKQPSIAPAREPTAWADGLADALPDWDIVAQPKPDDLFDQQVQW
jgi:hypothetical protein